MFGGNRSVCSTFKQLLIYFNVRVLCARVALAICCSHINTFHMRAHLHFASKFEADRMAYGTRRGTRDGGRRKACATRIGFRQNSREIWDAATKRAILKQTNLAASSSVEGHSRRAIKRQKRKRNCT